MPTEMVSTLQKYVAIFLFYSFLFMFHYIQNSRYKYVVRWLLYTISFTFLLPIIKNYHQNKWRFFTQF